MTDAAQDLPSYATRLPGEGARAFRAFISYRDQGAQRSLEAVGRGLGKSKALMERWSTTHSWVDRAAAWDAHLQRRRDEVALHAAGREAARDAVMWERRRRDSLEAAFRSSERLRVVADLMLEVPVARLVEVGGGAELRPVGKWATRDAAAMLRASAMIRASVFRAVARPVGEMSDEELRAIAGVDATDDEPGDPGKPEVPPVDQRAHDEPPGAAPCPGPAPPPDQPG